MSESRLKKGKESPRSYISKFIKYGTKIIKLVEIS